MSRKAAPTDVLVVGSGIAGIIAAIEARKQGVDVLIVTEGMTGRRGASFFSASPVRGIDASPEGDRQSIETHFREIVAAGLGYADETLARILAEEAPARLRELVESAGVAPRPGRFRGCFSDHPRTVQFDNLPALQKALNHCIAVAGIRVIEECAVTKLIVKNGVIVGASGLMRDGAPIAISTPSVILAAGGGCGLFERTLTSPHQIGDAYVLARHAGAEVRNLRFFQIMIGTRSPGINFFPLALFDDPRTRLVDDQGNDHTDRLRAAMALRNRHFPFTTRDASMAIDLAAAEMPFFADTSMGKFALFPCAHASNGGIVIDERAETSVRGLFACGEAATGMHGADRLGGNMFSAALVFGARAGQHAALRAHEGRDPAPTPKPKIDAARGWSDVDYRRILRDLRRMMTRCALLPLRARDLARGRNEAAEACATVEASRPVDRATIEGRRRALVAAECCLMMLDDMIAHPKAEGPHYFEKQK